MRRHVQGVHGAGQDHRLCVAFTRRPCERSAAGPASWIRESWPSTAMSKAACASTTRCCIKVEHRPPGSSPGDRRTAEIALLPNRSSRPGPGDDSGAWMFDFLRQEGLQPRIASFISAVPAWRSRNSGAPFSRSTTTSGSQLPSLFDLGDERAPSISPSLIPFFRSLPFNTVARCIASVVRRLEPSGRFYATWFENPDPANFEPIVHPTASPRFPIPSPTTIRSRSSPTSATPSAQRSNAYRARPSWRRVAAGHLADDGDIGVSSSANRFRPRSESQRTGAPRRVPRQSGGAGLSERSP